MKTNVSHASRFSLPYVLCSRAFMLLLLLLLLTPLFSGGQGYEHKNINSEELKRLIDNGAHVFIVDTRSEFEYRQGRIPKAISVPQEQFGFLEMRLPSDKDAVLVFYSRGYG